jgi:secondary thiamine-phosphate synthase enzyme
LKSYQKKIILKPVQRGIHLITSQIESNFSEIKNIQKGMLHIFLQHTSASITINENADPTVRDDMQNYFNKVVPENEPYFKHTYEGDDDMPAHIKSSILGCDLTIPITTGKLNLGAWQGIYLCEHRNNGGARHLILTAIGG